MDWKRIYRVYIVPPVIFQSGCIAGGYGTGREIAQFFTSHGALGGLYGLLASTLMLSVVVAVTFEFARHFRIYDYRCFFRLLLGRYWISFEILYFVTLLLVLAVIGSAADAILADQFRLPSRLGLFVMLGSIGLLAFYGREVITRIFTGWSVVFFAVLALLAAYSLAFRGDAIIASFVTGEAKPGWLGASVRFSSYSTVLAIVTLFAIRSIQTTRQALMVGTVCVFTAQIPAFLFHFSFLGASPGVLTAEVPVHSLIAELDVPFLQTAYTIVLFGTFIETGAGFIQALNERVDVWFEERSATPVPRWVHTALAVGAVIASMALAHLGIIALVAQGYANLVWGYLVVFIGPLLTIGIYKIVSQPAR